MKATGIVRRIDDLGRIVLPKELRRQLDMDDHAEVEIYTEEDCVILKKHAPTCIFCGAGEALLEYRGHNVCQSCRKALAEAAAQ